MIYDWIKPNQHIITIRNRDTGWARQKKVWNQKVIEKVLSEQKSSEDIYISKYPKNRLVDTVILDFDNKDDPNIAYEEVMKLHRYLNKEGLNSVIVESGSKGNHIYIQIAPVLFKDTEYRQVSSWNSFFNAFVCFLIHNSSAIYETLDKTNFQAGLNGNIRLINSKHPSTGKTCQIIKGSFKDIDSVTRVQSDAMKKAYLKLEIQDEDKKQKQLKRTKVLGGDNPIEVNDLREVFRQLTGDIKIYPKGYGYCCCPVHGDKHPSLLVTKEWFSCASCNFKGNVFTLRKMGFVEFDDKGVAKI